MDLRHFLILAISTVFCGDLMTAETITFKNVELSTDDVLKCSFSNWYSKFTSFSPQSIVIPVPKEFLQYLDDDSIRLPGESHIDINSDNEYSDWEEENEQDEEYEQDGDCGHAHPGSSNIFNNENFTKFKVEVESAINELGGSVAPKMNWSAPKDASWINPGNSIKTNGFNDILLLFKSSNHIVDDLQYPLSEVGAQENEIAVSNGQIHYELVLKRWLDINPALEFRVYVHSKKIIGISQRDLNHYTFLDDLKPKLRAVIEKFISTAIIVTFDLENYIVDVYVPAPYNKVTLIDINPFSRKTDLLLFTWNELLTEKAVDESEDFEFRLVDQTNLGRFSKKEYNESQVPIDVIDAAQNTETMVELAREWNSLQIKQDLDKLEQD
jgi:hypothetical protein